MAKITLRNGFTVIPEGSHIFKITDVTYKETFGKLEIKMETKEGLKHTERFTLIDGKGQPNEGAMNAFSFFAKTALNNFELTEIDHTDLVGRFMECVVEHDIQPSTQTKSGTVTFVRLTEKSPANGFDGDVATTPQKAKSVKAVTPKGSLNLDDILG